MYSGGGPLFNHETVDTASIVIARYVIPLLAGADIEQASLVNGALGRIRGNRMAKGQLKRPSGISSADAGQAVVATH